MHYLPFTKNEIPANYSKSQIEQMHSAIWLFPLLALITIMLLLLALFLLISPQTSNKKNSPQMPSNMGKLPQAQWYKLGMSQDWHDLCSTYPALGSEIGGTNDSHWLRRKGLHVWTHDCLSDYVPLTAIFNFHLDTWSKAERNYHLGATSLG